MEEYRKLAKQHFTTHPHWAAWVNAAMIVCFVGLGLVVLGGCLAFVYSRAVVVIASILEALGMITMLFGLFLAFIKKDDWALFLTTGIYALFELIMFIVFLAMGGLSIAPIFMAVAGGLLCVMAYRASEMYQKTRMRAAHEAAVYAQQAQTMGSKCANCGTPIALGATFCGACGAKQPGAKKCSGCGAALQPGDVFCGTCGTKN